MDSVDALRKTTDEMAKRMQASAKADEENVENISVMAVRCAYRRAP